MIVNNSQEAVAPSVASKSRRSRRASREKIIGNMACPDCRKAGGDSTGNHMMLFESGAGYCNRCPKSFSAEQVKEAKQASSSPRRTRRQYSGGYNNNYQKDLTVDDMVHLGYLGEKHRGITAATDRHFGIRTETDTTNGKPLARYYPYHVEGELYGYKKRILPKDWGKDVGTIKGTDMFGWHLLKGVKKTLIITEGEEDAAAAFQMHLAMNKRSENRRIKRSIPQVISLPSGAKGAHKILMHHFEEISKYEKIYWLGDNPKTDVEGKAALEMVISIFGANNVYVPEWPEFKKDPCDILKLGSDEAADVYAEMYFNAKPYMPSDIKKGSEYTWDEIFANPIVGYDIPFKSINERIKGFRLREHTLLLSASGVGKSTISRIIGHHMAKEHGWIIGSIFLEEQDKKTASGYIAAELDIALNLLREDPDQFSESDRQRAMDYIADKHIFLTHNGSIRKEELMSKIRYLHAMGAKMIITDHLSMAANSSDDERKELDELLEEMYKFTESHDVHLLSVIHLNRNGGNNLFARGSEISENNIRGSAGVLQQVWTCIAVEADIQHEEYSNARFFRILKCREVGEAVGLAKGGYLYDGKTGKLNYDESLHKDMVCPIKAKENQYKSSKPSMGGGSYDNKAV